MTRALILILALALAVLAWAVGELATMEIRT